MAPICPQDEACTQLRHYPGQASEEPSQLAHTTLEALTPEMERPAEKGPETQSPERELREHPELWAQTPQDTV